MSQSTTARLTAADYDRLAAEYLHSLPLEHFMEGQPHAFQRRITLDSLTALQSRRTDFDFFNELLVQYPFDGENRQVVPDNMVIRGTPTERQDRSSYAVELEEEHPFITFEYISPSAERRRKDYEESFRKYEQELRVPYCVFFDPAREELRVYRHNGTNYDRLPPDAQGRYSILELELHLGLLDGWVRFWHQGELLDLRPDLEERLERLQLENDDLSQENQILGQENQSLQSENSGLLELLRRRVEKRARNKGRSDILNLLPSTSDPEQLDQWLDELD